MSYAQNFPRCPDCGQETRVWRDTQETNRGQPNTWWCADCCTVLRIRYAEGAWDVYDLGDDGTLFRREARERGPGFLQRAMVAMDEIPHLPPAARYLFLQIALHADDTGAVQAGASTLSKWTHYRRAAVFQARRDLRERGMISWPPRGAGMEPTTYQVLPSDEWNPLIGPSPKSGLACSIAR